MKKRSLLFIIVICFFVVCCGCGADMKNISESHSLKIVTTNFPPYDFSREISGGNATVNMLLKPGMESHSYEPSPADIIAIKNSDIFIYTGGKSDAWVDTILETIDNPDLKVIKMMECADVLNEEFSEGMQGAHLHKPEHHHKDEFNHAEEYDEHIWTSPKNAIKIVKTITDAMMNADSKNADTYKKNSDEYIDKLDGLDLKLREICNGAANKTLIFGDRFPFRYLTEEYGLEYFAAFPGCSAEAEPSAKTVAYLIDKVKAENVKNIFYIEFSNKKIANAIYEETGAKTLMLHSCHNLSKNEREREMTYLRLMERNAENIKEALGR